MIQTVFMEKKIMNRKCEKCGADMVELFSSWVCSKACDKNIVVNDVDDKTKNDILTGGAIQSDKFRTSLPLQKEYNRSGSYPTPTEEEIQKQKKKMLKTLANFNTTAWQFIGQMDQLSTTTNQIIISLKKLDNAMTQKIALVQYQLVDYDKWYTGIHSGAFDVYQHKTMPVYRIEPRHTITNLKEFGDLVLSDPSFAQPIQNVKWDHIDPAIKELEKEMIKALGIPSHIISGVKDNCEKVRGQRATQIVMNEYCNLDVSIYDSVISSLKDGDSDEEKEKLKIQIEKLSPEDGDLLIFKMPPLSSDEDFHNVAKRLEELELDAKSIVIPDSITVEYVPLSRNKDNDNSKE